MRKAAPGERKEEASGALCAFEGCLLMYLFIYILLLNPFALTIKIWVL
jgi:hypothetical protein